MENNSQEAVEKVIHNSIFKLCSHCQQEYITAMQTCPHCKKLTTYGHFKVFYKNYIGQKIRKKSLTQTNFGMILYCKNKNFSR